MYPGFKFVAIDVPKTYTEAIHGSHSTQWVEANKNEMNFLMENKTWTLVPLPPGRKAIKSKWLFKVKYLPGDKLDKFKARLVVLGCLQKYLLDYTETYAPVAKSTTIRIVLAITVKLQLKLLQVDFNTAFLNGELHQQIYMEQPNGFVSNTHRNYVCLLKKSLYGLKQATRQWNQKLHSLL